MKSPVLAPGEILPLVRRIPGSPDPLALFGALTGNAAGPDTLLLESADAASGRGERSILLPRTMLRLEGRGSTVWITPLTPNGTALRDWLATMLVGAAVHRRASPWWPNGPRYRRGSSPASGSARPVPSMRFGR